MNALDLVAFVIVAAVCVLIAVMLWGVPLIAFVGILLGSWAFVRVVNWLVGEGWL